MAKRLQFLLISILIFAEISCEKCEKGKIFAENIDEEITIGFKYLQGES